MKNKFFRKAGKEFLRLGRMLVYHNYQLKPAGVYPTSAAYVKASPDPRARYTPIYENQNTVLPLPKALYDAVPTYNICDTVTIEGATPALRAQPETFGVVEIPNGRLYTDNEITVAIISADNKLIGDVSFQHVNATQVSPHDSTLFKQRYFVEPEKYPGAVFNLLPGGGGVSNYFHWIIDVLPRLHLLREAGLFDKIDWFLVPNYKLGFQRETLSMLGIPADKIIEGKDQLHIQADLLVTSSHPRGFKSQLVPNWVIQFYRDTFLGLPSGKTYSPYVFVSRKDSNIRQVTNEDALMDLLRPYGFVSYELSKLSLLEKKDLFASAKVIVAASGAGLTNMMFSAKGATLVEFFPDGFVNTHYYNIAHYLELDYHFLVCNGPKQVSRAKAGQSEDLTVDLEAMEEITARIFATHALPG